MQTYDWFSSLFTINLLEREKLLGLKGQFVFCFSMVGVLVKVRNEAQIW